MNSPSVHRDCFRMDFSVLCRLINRLLGKTATSALKTINISPRQPTRRQGRTLAVCVLAIVGASLTALPAWADLVTNVNNAEVPELRLPADPFHGSTALG